MELDNDIMRSARMATESTDGLFPIFHHETRRDEVASEAAGKPVYAAIPYIEIIAPGNDKERINRKVKPEDKMRWPEQWRQFEEGREEPVFDGMPITEWHMADKHIARTLKESNIFTVEQLAQVPDVNIQMLGAGMMNLKSKARKWVKDQDGSSKELEAAMKEIAELKAVIADLIADKYVEPAPTLTKSASWYTFDGKKYREADLPPEAADALKAFKEQNG